MKYWTKDRVENGTGIEGLLLKDGMMNRILSLSKTDDNHIYIIEECDGYYGIEMSKKNAIKAFEEAIKWIKEN